jgi:hypothetical protein
MTTHLSRVFQQMSGGQAMKDPAMTPEQAQVRLAALQRDTAFRERLFSFQADARAEWNSLIHIAAGPEAMPAEASMAQRQAQARLNNLVADPSWRQRRLAGDIEAEQQFKELARILATENEREAP